MSLLQRKIELTFTPQAGGTEVIVRDLHVEFEVVRSLEKEPSTMSVSIFNMKDDTVNVIREQKDSVATLRVAYGPEGLQTIFVGDVNTIRQRLDGPNRIAEIEAGDGKRSSKFWAQKRFPKKTKLEDVIVYLANAAGLKAKKSDVSSVLDDARSQNQNRSYYSIPRDLKHGIHVRGYAIDELHEICLSHQIEASIQNNALRLTIDDATVGTAPTLTPSSGLIGSPTVSKEKKGNKTVTITNVSCLLVPGLFPGSEVQIDSRYVKGAYRVHSATYTGSLYGDSPMTIDFEAQGL